MLMIQEGRYHDNFQTRLNISAERPLLKTPDVLINRLDLLLLAGTMSDDTRSILRRYINSNINSRRVDRERVLRDVITLTFLSADYVVQR